MVAQMGEIVKTSSGSFSFPLNNRPNRGIGVCFVKSMQLAGGRAKPSWSPTYSQPSALSSGSSLPDLFPAPNLLQRNLLSPDQHLPSWFFFYAPGYWRLFFPIKYFISKIRLDFIFCIALLKAEMLLYFEIPVTG